MNAINSVRDSAAERAFFEVTAISVCKVASLLALLGVFQFHSGVALAATDEPQAREIMQKVDARDEGDNSTSAMTMTLIDKRGKKRVRRIRSYKKDFEKDKYSIMFFEHPADVKGTSFMTYDYDDATRDDDQWLWLPALKKTRRIAGADKSGSFMGSDFNYSDMSGRDLEDYDFRLLKEDQVRGLKVWVIEVLPRTKAVMEETGYSKGVVFVRQDNYFIVRAVRWVEGSARLKYLDVKRVEQIDGIWVGTVITMTTKSGKRLEHKTVLELSDVKFGQALKEGTFTLRSMEKGVR